MGCVDVGIIGGTGIGERLAAYPSRALHIPTRVGVLRGRVIEHDGARIFAIDRHSRGHSVPPHRVNYAAIAEGVKGAGARACLSTAAVGAMRPDWKPGTFVACSDFLDFTGRNLTLFDRSVVHRDFSAPFGKVARLAILAAAHDHGTAVQDGVYLCTNGPRYETPCEIELYRSMGADVIGMTAASEAILFREAEVEYACLAIVTNLAAGMSTAPLDHQDVVEEMSRAGSVAVEILLRAASRLAGGK